MKVIFLLSAIAFAAPAYSLEECNFFSLEKNIEEVQSRKAKGKIKDLFRCEDEQYRFSAYQWYVIDEKLNKIEKPKLVYTLQKPPKSTGDDFIDKARANDYFELYGAVRTGNDNYVANAKGILALARSLFRSGKYKDSIYYYDLYFKYKNSDDLVEAEKLFSLIVMKDYEEAYNTINNLKTFEISPFLQVSILNAEKLMEKQFEESDKPDNQSLKYLDGTINVDARYMSDSYQGTLAILESKYHDGFYAYGAAVQSTGASLQQAINAGYMEAGYEDVILGILRIKAGLGYYAFRDGLLTYSAGAGLSLFSDMSINFDYSKTPLVFYHPLEEVGMEVADNRFIFNYKWADFVDLNLMLAYEDDLRARELYELDLAYPVLLSKDRMNFLKIILPFYYKRRLKVSPYYRSFPSELRFEAGMDYRKVLSELFSVRMLATGGFVSRNHFSQLDARDNIFSFNALARINYRVYKENFIYARFEMDSVDAEQLETKRQTRDTIALGIDFKTL